MKKLTIDRIRWTLRFNVHVTRSSRRSAAFVSVGLSVVPEVSSVAQAKRVKRGEWVRALGRAMEVRGYSGGWLRSTWGGAALWSKELSDLAELEAELASIPTYDVTAVLRPWVQPTGLKKR